MTIRLFRPPDTPAPGDARPLDHTVTSRYRAAAHHARHRYPGPLGELVHRELTAYADFGYRLGSDSLAERLAADVLQACVPDPGQPSPDPAVRSGRWSDSATVGRVPAPLTSVGRANQRRLR